MFKYCVKLDDAILVITFNVSLEGLPALAGIIILNIHKITLNNI